MASRGEKFQLIGKCLDRFEERIKLPDERINCFIDLDVSKVNVEKLLAADDMTFFHDMGGIFRNIQRNGDEPEKSTLGVFMPRVGLEAEVA